MKSRIREIVETLNASPEGMKTNGLANRLEVSEKTIRDEIGRYQATAMQKSVRIDQKQGKFCLWKMVAFSPASWKAWLDALDQETFESQDRIEFILRYLVLNDSWVRLEELAEQMGVSNATFHRDFKIVKERLKERDLRVHSKPGYGVQIAGSELAKRIVFAHTFTDEQKKDVERFCAEVGYDAEAYYRIEYHLRKILNQYALTLTETGLRNLVIHVLCAMDRIRHDNVLEQTGLSEEVAQDEKKAAIAFIEALESEFALKFPESEISYIQLHLLSKRANYDNQTVMLSEQTEQILNQGFQKLYEERGIDFRGDLELATMLAMHIEPMISRMEYGLSIPNPLLDQVRSMYPDAYDCAVGFADLMLETFGLKTNDDELGYLSLHFHTSLERMRKKKKWNVLVVCTSGYGSAVFLKKKLQSQYELDEEHIRLTRIDEIDVLQDEKYDFIFTNVPLICTTKVPVIQMENILSPLPRRLADLKQSVWSLLSHRQAFFQKSFAKKDEVIRFLCEKMKEIYDLPPDFENLVFKRERLSSTEIGNYVAIPHPYAMCTPQTLIGLCTLKKAIVWNQRKVKFVFLVSYAKKDLAISHSYNEQLMERLLDADWIGQLEKCETYEQFEWLIER